MQQERWSGVCMSQQLQWSSAAPGGTTSTTSIESRRTNEIYVHKNNNVDEQRLQSARNIHQKVLPEVTTILNTYVTRCTKKIKMTSQNTTENDPKSDPK